MDRICEVKGAITREEDRRYDLRKLVIAQEDIYYHRLCLPPHCSSCWMMAPHSNCLSWAPGAWVVPCLPTFCGVWRSIAITFPTSITPLLQLNRFLLMALDLPFPQWCGVTEMSSTPYCHYYPPDLWTFIVTLCRIYTSLPALTHLINSFDHLPTL